jgi:predicted Zn finger-like uncharacterized protein
LISTFCFVKVEFISRKVFPNRHYLLTAEHQKSMIVNCDKCGAKFQLADEKVTDKGVKVRCSKCKAVFTVKAGDEAAEPSAPGPSTPSQPPPKQSGSGGGSGDDPFADFNFSDDLDFGSDSEDDFGMEDEAADSPPAPSGEPPAPASVSSDFMDDAPGAPVSNDDDFGSFDDGDLDSGSNDSDENFDFNDEEFSLSDEPADKEKPPAPSSGGDDGDDFHFDDESFSEPAASPAPPPPPPVEEKKSSSDDGDWGNVSFTDGGGGDDGASEGLSDDELGDEIDEAGFGDFQFDSDDSLPSGDDDSVMEVDDFVRSPKKDSSSSDNLEASIGDDYEPEKRDEERSETMAPPPKPLKKSGPKQKGSKLWMVILFFVILIGSPIGLVFYTGSQGWFSFGDLFSGDFAKIKEIPAVKQYMIDRGIIEEPEIGVVEIKGKAKVEMVTREDEVVVIVVKGDIINRSNKAQSNIKVEVGLKNKDTDEVVATGYSYCDVSFSMDDIQTMERATIESLMNAAGGRNQECNQVTPGVTMPFTVVFFEFPDMKLGVTKPKVVEYKRSGAVDLHND